MSATDKSVEQPKDSGTTPDGLEGSSKSCTTSHDLVVQEPPKEVIELARQLCAIVGKAQSQPSAQGRKDATGKWGVHCLVISPFKVAPPMLPGVITNNLRRKRASFGVRSSRCFCQCDCKHVAQQLAQQWSPWATSKVDPWGSDCIS